MKAVTLKSALVCMAASAALSGCYVVPVGQYPVNNGTPNAPAVLTPPGPTTLSARLYPSNDTASKIGIIGGSIVSQANGHGTFSFVVGGEQFSGESTRNANSSSGTANAAGNRGGYMRCTYTMNNSTQGTGNCTMGTGATFSMHITS